MFLGPDAHAVEKGMSRQEEPVWSSSIVIDSVMASVRSTDSYITSDYSSAVYDLAKLSVGEPSPFLKALLDDWLGGLVQAAMCNLSKEQLSSLYDEMRTALDMRDEPIEESDIVEWITEDLYGIAENEVDFDEL